MILAISGTPGCGKTQTSKQLATMLSSEHIELTEFIKKHNVSESFDEETQSLVVDMDVLNTAITTQLATNKSYVIDGHFSHEIECIDGCIICTCDITELNKRLIERGYDEKKVRENLDSEIFQICYTESIENGVPTSIIECTTPVSESELERVYKELLNLIKSAKA